MIVFSAVYFFTSASWTSPQSVRFVYAFTEAFCVKVNQKHLPTVHFLGKLSFSVSSFFFCPLHPPRVSVQVYCTSPGPVTCSPLAFRYLMPAEFEHFPPSFFCVFSSPPGPTLFCRSHFPPLVNHSCSRQKAAVNGLVRQEWSWCSPPLIGPLRLRSFALCKSLAGNR